MRKDEEAHHHHHHRFTINMFLRNILDVYCMQSRKWPYILLNVNQQFIHTLSNPITLMNGDSFFCEERNCHHYNIHLFLFTPCLSIKSKKYDTMYSTHWIHNVLHLHTKRVEWYRATIPSWKVEQKEHSKCPTPTLARLWRMARHLKQDNVDKTKVKDRLSKGMNKYEAKASKVYIYIDIVIYHIPYTM